MLWLMGAMVNGCFICWVAVLISLSSIGLFSLSSGSLATWFSLVSEIISRKGAMVIVLCVLLLMGAHNPKGAVVNWCYG